MDGAAMTVFGITLGDYGAGALLALFIVLIFLGRWVPSKERDQWRDLALKSADQVDRLIESVEPMVKFITELKERSPKQRGDDQ
jgi:hypothetical protein